MNLVFSCDTLRAIDGVMHIDLDPYYSYGGHNLLIGFKQIVLGTSESINWCGEYGHSNAAVVSYKTSATSLTTISRQPSTTKPPTIQEYSISIRTPSRAQWLSSVGWHQVQTSQAIDTNTSYPRSPTGLLHGKAFLHLPLR